jgi:hypothetical protein
MSWSIVPETMHASVRDVCDVQKTGDEVRERVDALGPLSIVRALFAPGAMRLAFFEPLHLRVGAGDVTVTGPRGPSDPFGDFVGFAARWPRWW